VNKIIYFLLLISQLRRLLSNAIAIFFPSPQYVSYLSDFHELNPEEDSLRHNGETTRLSVGGPIDEREPFDEQAEEEEDDDDYVEHQA
jgi:hypothetical protein